MTIKEMITIGEKKLIQAGIADASNDARELVCHVTGRDRTGIIMHINDEISDEEASEYLKAVDLRASRVPLQHITGEQEFMGYRFKVRPNVLIPRFDTEVLVEEASKRAVLGAKILDLCTGSGIIGIALKKICFGAQVTLTDLSEDALELSRENAKLNGADVRIIKSDMFDSLDPGELFTMIVSNPPYIPEDEIEELDPEVRDHDPKLALSGGRDGLDYYRIIARDAHRYLSPGGWLLLEIGYDQGETVPELLRETGEYSDDIEVIKDLSGNDRVAAARKK